MKKTYMQPAMMLVKVKTEVMLQVSQLGGSTNETSGNATKRRRGIFQDDAVEEEQSIW